jgi:hypothetical protein
MQIFELASFPIDQIRDRSALAQEIGAWFADRPWPSRLLAYSRRSDLGPARRRAERRLQTIASGQAGGPQSWAVPWLRDALRFYQALDQQHLRSAQYLLLTWEPPGVSQAALLPTVRRSFQRAPRLIEHVPPPILCDYREHDGILQAERPGAPFLACMLSYEMRGSIDLDALHALMSVPYDLALALDVQTRPQARVLARSERAYMAARAASSDWRQKDARAERQLADAEQALHELVHQNLHDIQVGVLVAGETRAELEAHLADVAGLLGSRLKLFRPLGVQGEALRLWSATPAAQIDIPWKRRNVFSHGVGCLAGLVTYHRASGTNGLLWGVDGQRLAPLMLDLFADRKAAHMVVLGKTGYGKTYFLNTMALRAAALEGYRVIMIDAFENAARVRRAARSGAQERWLTLETPINILDRVFDDEGWLAPQIEHVISQLGLLMGTLGLSAANQKVLVPRLFRPEERGVLDRALTQLYERSAAVSSEHSLQLAELVAVLDALGEPEARQIADTLNAMLRGSRERSAPLNAFGQRFNASTGMRWSFDSPITCYDMGAISARAPEWLPFYYAQVIGAINRYMRDPRRDRSRPTLLIIDEYGYAAQIESVARLAADICKVARKYGIGLLVVDQSPHTFQSPTGKDILDNAPAKILFHLDDEPARLAGELIGDLTPAHVEFLGRAERGEAVAVFGNDVHILLVESSAQERRFLMGS